MPATTITITTDEHPAQQAFVDDQNTETGYIGGVGSGKTAGGVFRAGRHISDWNEGHTGIIVSPTASMGRNVIVPELRKWGLLDKPGVEHNRSENRIEYPNGSTILLESANNDRKIERLRGLNLAWAWMDEAAYHPEKVYQILSDRLRVGDYRNLFVTTTPRGFNWVYDVFGDTDGIERAIADGRMLRDDTTTSIIGVSTRANPGNPEDYIEREERQHAGESYQQEIEGEFTEFEGLIYRWFDDDNLVEEPPETYDETIYGVDWGHNNPSVIIALVREGEMWTVVEEWYETRQTVNDHSRALDDMQERWGSGAVYCDPAEPANIEQFQRDRFDAYAAQNDVIPGIQYVTSQRENIRVVENCQDTRNEFAQYQYRDGDTEQPAKANDHIMDALRYALFTYIEQHGRPGGEVYSLGL